MRSRRVFVYYPWLLISAIVFVGVFMPIQRLFGQIGYEISLVAILASGIIFSPKWIPWVLAFLP